MTSTMTQSSTTHYVGQLGGRRMCVNIRLGVDLRNDHLEQQTVEHDDAGPCRIVLGVMGNVIALRAKDIDQGGQIVGALDQLDVIAQGWTRADIDSLAAIWRRWHLNGTRAACAHMDVDQLVREPDRYSPGGERISTRAPENTCPVSGYRYGHAWLHEDIPADVIAEIQRLQQLPTGRVPSWL